MIQILAVHRHARNLAQQHEQQDGDDGNRAFAAAGIRQRGQQRDHEFRQHHHGDDRQWDGDDARHDADGTCGLVDRHQAEHDEYAPDRGQTGQTGEEQAADQGVVIDAVQFEFLRIHGRALTEIHDLHDDHDGCREGAAQHHHHA